MKDRKIRFIITLAVSLASFVFCGLTSLNTKINTHTVYAQLEDKETISIDTDIVQRFIYTGDDITPVLKDKNGELISVGGFSFEYSMYQYSDYASCTNTIEPGLYKAHITRDEDDTYKEVDTYIEFVVTYSLTYKANSGLGDDIIDIADDDTIHKDYFGAYCDDEPDTYYFDKKAIIKANSFTKENYTFAFWNTKEDGTGISYKPAELVTLKANTILYACYSADIDVQPNKDNDYTVNVKTSDDVTYIWEKETQITTPIDLTKGISSGDVDSTNKTITAELKGTTYQIIIAGNSKKKLMFYSEGELNDSVIGDNNTYTYTAKPGKAPYYLITSSSSFTISNINYLEVEYQTIEDENTNSITNAILNTNYRLKVVSKYNAISYSDVITPKKVSFELGDNVDGTAPSNMYQLEGRSITIPTTTATKNGYKYLGWNTNKDATVALSFTNGKYTVGDSDTTFYAIWKSLAYDSEVTLTMTTLKYGVKREDIALSISDSNLSITSYELYYYDEDANDGEGDTIKVTSVDEPGLYTLCAIIEGKTEPYYFVNTHDSNQYTIIPDYYKGGVVVKGNDVYVGIMSFPLSWAVTSCDITSEVEFFGEMSNNAYENTVLGNRLSFYLEGKEVTYDDNVEDEDIEVPTDNNTYLKDSYATISSSIPTRDGYTFIGWNTNPNAFEGLEFTNNKYKIGESDITLYAIWGHECDGLLYNVCLNDYLTNNVVLSLNKGNYYLSSDLTYNSAFDIASNAEVNICLNGYKLEFNTNASIKLLDGSSLYILDCMHYEDNHGSFVYNSTTPTRLFELYATTLKTASIGFYDVDVKTSNGSLIGFDESNEQNSGNANITFNNCLVDVNSANFVFINSKGNVNVNVIDTTINSIYDPESGFLSYLFYIKGDTSKATINYKNASINANRSGVINAIQTTANIDEDSILVSNFNSATIVIDSTDLYVKGAVLNQYVSNSKLYDPEWTAIDGQYSSNIYLYASAILVSPHGTGILLETGTTIPKIIIKEKLTNPSPIKIYNGEDSLKEGDLIYDFKKYNQDSDIKDHFVVEACSDSDAYIPFITFNDDSKDIASIAFLRFTKDLPNDSNAVDTNCDFATYSWYNVKYNNAIKLTFDDFSNYSGAVYDDTKGDYFKAMSEDFFGEYKNELPENVTNINLVVCAGEYEISANSGENMLEFGAMSTKQIKFKLYIKFNGEEEFSLLDDSDVSFDLGSYNDGYFFTEVGFNDSENMPFSSFSMTFDTTSSKYEAIETTNYTIKLLLEEDTIWNDFSDSLVNFVLEESYGVSLVRGFIFYFTYTNYEILNVIEGKTTKELPNYLPGAYLCRAAINDGYINSNVYVIDLFDVDIDEDIQEKTYNGSNQGFDLKGTNKDLDNFKVEIYFNRSWQESNPSEAGSYDVRITREEDTIYKAYSKTITNGLIINPYVVNEGDITLCVDDFTYNGLDQLESLTCSYKNVFNEVVELEVYDCGFSNVNRHVGEFKDAGEYEVVFRCKTSEETNNYRFVYNDDEAKRYYAYFTMKKASYDMSNTKWNYTSEFTYDNTSKVVEVSNLPNGVSVNEYTENSKTNAGNYVAKVSFNYDTNNYNKPTIDDLNWTINKATYNMSNAKWNYASEFTYDNTNKVVEVTNLPSGVSVNKYTDNSKTNAGNYVAKVSFNYDSVNYNEPTINDLNWTINKVKVNEPKVASSYVYNGEPFVVSLVGLEDYMFVSGTLSATEAGVYKLIVSLDDNHCWFEGNDGIISWEIKASSISNKKDETTKDNKEVIVSTDQGFSNDITVIVEVTVETEVADATKNEKLTIDYYNITDENAKLDNNEKVAIVFDVKLVQTINGVAKEIQPSDIKEGTKIKVKMPIPEDIDISKVTKILHVHSKDDIEVIVFNPNDVIDGYYEIEIDRLSEFAFIYKDSFPAWAVILIVLGSLLLIIAGLYLIWKKEYENSIDNDSTNNRILKLFDVIYMPIYKLIHKANKNSSKS